MNLTETDRQELERWMAAHRTPQQVSQRCRIILAAAQGEQDRIADDLDLNFKTAALWRKRFIREGSDGLWEVAAGRGRDYFLNVRIYATTALMASSFMSSAGFISTLPCLSLKPSLTALKAALSVTASWTLGSV